MKIHFIISSLQGGGAERVLTLMANNLSKKSKYDISVITLFEGNSYYKLHSSIHKFNLKQTKFIPSLTISSILNLSKYYLKKSNRPDVIISFITLTNLITIIVAKIFSIKIIAQEHNSHLHYMKGHPGLTNFTKKYLYNKADALTVLTSFDVPFYKKYGVNVIVMPNPCSFKAITKNTHYREKVILAVGHLDRYHHKGFDNLILMIAPILKQNTDWQLAIAGSGNLGLKFLTKLAEENGISKRVNFIGFVDNIAEIMRKSSIFILPSRFEGLPMVLLEAMSQGMACIAYDCKTGPADIIKQNKNGLLIEDQNIIKMQKALNELLKNDILRKRVADEGIISLQKYDIDVITKQYETLINKLLN